MVLGTDIPYRWADQILNKEQGKGSDRRVTRFKFKFKFTNLQVEIVYNGRCARRLNPISSIDQRTYCLARVN